VPLSTVVSDRHSLVRQFLEQRFPLIDATKQGALMAGDWKRLLGIAGVERDAAHDSAVPGAQRRVIGTALDYRLRYYFSVTPSDELVAARGARLLRRRGAPARARPVASLVQPFLSSLDEFLTSRSPVGRALSDSDEERLARYCVVLAHLEAFFRAGTDIESPLYSLVKGSTLEDLLAVPPEHQVRDLCALSRECFEDGRELFGLPCVLNPAFDGSADIGGADADLVVGQCLLEVKTVSSAHAGTVREAVYQLLGYTLLDYSDRYGIRQIGVWLTRQRCIWVLPLAQALTAPAALLHSGALADSVVDQRLSELRDELADVLKRPRAWRANGRPSLRMLAMPEAVRISRSIGGTVEELMAEAERRARQRATHELFVDEMIQDILWEIEAERGQKSTDRSTSCAPPSG